MPVVVVTAIIVLSLTATSCWAHGRKRDNFETVAIAAGAVVLINALVNPGYYSPPAVCYNPTVVYVTRPRTAWHRHPSKHWGKHWGKHRSQHSNAWRHRPGQGRRPW